MATSKKVQTQAADDMDIARKIWLAGVGAYGRMFAETQGAMGKLAGSANETFEQLVANGEQVEDAVRARIAKSGTAEKVVSLVGTVTKQVSDYREGQRKALDARIGQVRKTVADTLAPFNIASLAHSIEQLTQKVDALSADVAKLKGTKSKKTAA